MNIKKKILRFFIPFFIGIIFLELLIRVWTISNPNFRRQLRHGGAHPQHLIIADEELGYVLNSDFSCQETNDFQEYQISVKINSYGIRDYERDLSKKAYRILAIGNSYTFGEGVELENSFLSVLENKLSQKFQTEIEVIKAGIPGYSTAQEIGLLQRLIPIYQPKIVLMGLLPEETQRIKRPYTYFAGFIVDSAKVNQLYLIRGNLYSSKKKNPIIARLDAWRKHLFLTLAFFKSRSKSIRKIFKRAEAEQETKEQRLSKQELEEKFKKTFKLLKEFKSICQNYKATPLLILIEGNPQEDEFIKNFTKKINISTLSLYPYFKKAADNNIAYHYKHDLHWDPTGHAIAAEAIFEFIISKRIIKLNP